MKLKKLLQFSLLLCTFILFMPFLVHADGNKLTIYLYKMGQFSDLKEIEQEAISFLVKKDYMYIEDNNGDNKEYYYSNNGNLLFYASNNYDGMLTFRDDLTFNDNIDYTFSSEDKEELKNGRSELVNYDGIKFLVIHEEIESVNNYALIKFYARETVFDVDDYEFDAFNILRENGLIYFEEDHNNDIVKVFSKNGKLLFESGNDNDSPIIINSELTKAYNIEYTLTNEDKEWLDSFESDLANYDGFRFLFVSEEVSNCESVCIEQIQLDSKSDDITIYSPTVEDSKIMFDLKFTKVNEFVKYKITIKNNTDEDLEVDTNRSSNNHITYEVDYDDNSNIIKKNSNKIVYVTVKYNSKIDKEDFIDGQYLFNDVINLSLSDNTIDVPDTLKNPIAIYLLINFLALLIGFAVYLIIHRKYNMLSIIIVGILFIIPLSTKALRKYSIQIESKIRVVKTITITYDKNDDNAVGNIEPQVVEYGTAAKIMAGVSLDKHYLWTWNTKPDGMGDRYPIIFNHEENYVVFNDDIKLYAIWSQYIYYGVNRDSNNVETLVISDEQNTNQSPGLSFSSENVLNPNNVAWTKTNSYGCAGSMDDESSIVEVRGEVRPLSTSYWFYNLGCFVNNISARVPIVMDLRNLNMSRVTDAQSMFANIGGKATSITMYGLASWDMSKVRNMNNMFSSFGTWATNIDIEDMKNWDTSNVTSMKSLFYDVGYNSSSINIDISNWNTSKVENMDNMFSSMGYSATTWNVVIPKTNGNGLQNTPTRLYGKDETVYAEPPEGRTFTVAS